VEIYLSISLRSALLKLTCKKLEVAGQSAGGRLLQRVLSFFKRMRGARSSPSTRQSMTMRTVLNGTIRHGFVSLAMYLQQFFVHTRLLKQAVCYSAQVSHS
jgi:hypothetical protein